MVLSLVACGGGNSEESGETTNTENSGQEVTVTPGEPDAEQVLNDYM